LTPGRASCLHAGGRLGEGADREPELASAKAEIGLVRERFFTPRLPVTSYEELNAWLLDRCVAYTKAHKHPELQIGRQQKRLVAVKWGMGRHPRILPSSAQDMNPTGC
jgi:hypothetical protein